MLLVERLIGLEIAKHDKALHHSAKKNRTVRVSELVMCKKENAKEKETYVRKQKQNQSQHMKSPVQVCRRNQQSNTKWVNAFGWLGRRNKGIDFVWRLSFTPHIIKANGKNVYESSVLQNSK